MMGVIVYSDENIFNKLKKLAEEGLFFIGLTVTQKSHDQTYVTHLVPLPFPEGDELKDADGDQITNKQKEMSVHSPASISDVVGSNVATHSQQVVRMLPGGLDVEGLYVIMPISELNNSATQGKLRSILSSVHKATSKYFLGTAESSLEKIVMYGCPQTLKVGVKSIDLSEHGTCLVSGNLKIQDVNWLQLRFSYDMSIPIYLPKEKNSPSLNKVVMTAFGPWAQLLRHSLILIDGKTTEEHELNTASVKEDVVLEVKILEDQEKLPPNITTGIKEYSGKIHFQGTIAGMAFLNGKATADERKDAVIKDVIRSLVSKWEMHCDSLVEEPFGTSGTVMHEPPRRVFLKDESSTIVLCDYLFPGDSISDACHSAKEILAINIQEENVDDTVEKWADNVNFCSAESIGTTPFTDEECYNEISNVKRSNAFQFFIAFLIAVLGVGFYFFMNSRKR